MAKGQKVREIAGRVVREFLKVWLCGKVYRLPATPEILEVLEKSKTDEEALEKLNLKSE
jgi:hypothetical protein